jgi:predicted phage-related endonuclease
MNAMMLPSKASEWIRALDNLNAMEKMLKEQKAEAQNALKAMLGEFEQGIFNDRQISWKNQKGRESIDIKRLKMEMPEVYEHYKTVGNPTRVFKLK